jgi:PAS domain S-box-containing protein
MSVSPPVSILFVDDSELGNLALLEALQKEGYQVQQVRTGKDALEQARCQPDLVILDVHLPDMNGFEVCRRIKACPETASTLVLHLSGHYVRSEDRAVGLDSGADGYLLKPVTARELVANVKALLRARQAETALHASELRLQHILDHAPVLVHVKDIHGRYLLVNRQWEHLFHLDRFQVQGKTVFDLFPAEQAQQLRSNDLRVIDSRAPLHLEEIVPQDDGLHTYLSVKFPLLGPDNSVYAVCGISTDISERKQMTQALRDSEALYHSLVESLPVALFRKDKNGRFTFGNHAFCAELGIRQDELPGKSDSEVYAPDRARQAAEEDHRVIETAESEEAIEVHPHPDGGKRYLEVLKTPLRDASGVVVGMQGILWDVTARKRAVEELGRTAAEFRVARQIQQRLFPLTAPQLPGLDIGGATFGFDIGGASYPAEAIGGDYYDYLCLPDGSLGVAIGDVSGHGIGPALLMAEARAYLRAFAQTHTAPATIMGCVHRLLLQDIEGDRFITLLLARLDPRTQLFEYASAGHPTAYILDREGRVRRTLPSTGIPLGILPEVELPHAVTLTLQAGDILLFLTDGVVEARDPEGATFGSERALALVRIYRDLPARQIVENIYHAVRAFTQNLPQYDDITATVVKLGWTGS